MLVNPAARSETLRLRDLKTMRVESRRRLFRRMVTEKVKEELVFAANCQHPPTVLPEKVDAVSDAPLPVAW
jgi:hypothetical protein